MERITDPISDAELGRRWSLCRAALRAGHLDAMIAQNTNDWLGGYVKWLTDVPANNGYPRTVIFYADGPMTIVEMGPKGAVRDFGGNDRVHRGVGSMAHTPSFLSIACTHRDDAALVVSDLAARGAGRVGFVGKGALPHEFVTHIERELPAVRFGDVTETIDRLKAIKSSEEAALIARTAAMQDAIFASVISMIRPGVRDIDVTAHAQAVGQKLGSEQGIFLGVSAPVGVRSGFMGRHHQGRKLEAGDHLSLLIENNGPGGFYTEMARTIVLGQASRELNEAFASVKAAQDHTLSLLRPGARPADVHAAHNAFMIARGLPPELRLYAHGQGYDMVERPLIRDDETMLLAEGMCLAVHPGYETDALFAVICDNYMLGADGPGPCLHKTEKKIFEI